MNNNSKPEWSKLHSLATQMKPQPLWQLFNDDPSRYQEFNLNNDGLRLDFSKQRINTEIVEQLLKLAESEGLQNWIECLFNGDKVNNTEDRPALHTALRSPKHKTYYLDQQNISQAVHENLDKLEAIVENIHSGQWRGYSGDAIEDVVNIGVGGSDLGPVMACHALSEYQPQSSRSINVHFVSSMDGSQLSKLLGSLKPSKTLFVIASKSFSTIDTMANAATAKEWLRSAASCSMKAILSRHFIAVSASLDKAKRWGIPSSNQLQFWDWTGGRYSMWSTIGLPIALKLGSPAFHSILAGAHSMDEHFRNTEFQHNLPVMLALIGIWNINFLDINAHAILPYDGRLKHLPAYLEQLEMESNGKSIDRNGHAVNHKTCPILWGDVGTNAQHAFYQLLHQGTQDVMCDFIVAANRYHNSNNSELSHQHQLNLSNCLAQSRILALGDSIIADAKQSPDYKRYSGNQPCTTLLIEELTAYNFGRLIALYEHKVFVQSVIWNINPFDQWGVELGKTMATDLMEQLNKTGSRDPHLDSSTEGLLNSINTSQQRAVSKQNNNGANKP